MIAAASPVEVGGEEEEEEEETEFIVESAVGFEARPEESMGSDEPVSREAAVAAAATLNKITDRSINNSSAFIKNGPKQCAKYIKTI